MKCTCRWYGVTIPGEPQMGTMYEAEPDPFCPEHFPPRWKVACINWTSSEAPHATTYLLIDGEAHASQYHDTWADAVQWLDDHANILKPLAAEHLKRLREEWANA